MRNHQEAGTRRNFLRISLAVIAAPCAPLLNGCASLLTRTVTPENGTLRLALNQYPELARRDGLIRVLPAGAADPIYIIVKEEGQFSAVSSVCTHLECTIEPGGSGANMRLECPCHGSMFDREGQVLRGPAERPLARFRTELTGGVVVVHLGGSQ